MKRIFIPLLALLVLAFAPAKVFAQNAQRSCCSENLQQLFFENFDAMASPCPANLGFTTENVCMTAGNAINYGEYGVVSPSGPQNDYDAALQRSWWNYPAGKPVSRAMVVDGPNVQGVDPGFNPHGVPMRTVSVRIALNLTEAGAYCFKAAVGSASNAASLGRPRVFLAISEQAAPDGNSLWHSSGTPKPGNATNLNLAASQPQSLSSVMLQSDGWQFLTASVVVANPGMHYFYVVLDNNAPNASFQGINYIIDDIEIYRSQVAPSVTVSALPAEICAGNSSTLTAAGADVYTWSAGTLPASGASVTASPASTATYTVTGQNGGDPSCTSTASVAVVVNGKPDIGPLQITPSGCEAGAFMVSVDVSSPPSRIFVNGDFLEEQSLPSFMISYANAQAGLYLLRVEDAAGCEAGAEIEVPGIPRLRFWIVSYKVPVQPNQADRALIFNAIKGTPPIEYSIDGQNYQSLGVFQNLRAGRHTIYARDSEGCVIQREIDLQ